MSLGFAGPRIARNGGGGGGVVRRPTFSTGRTGASGGMYSPPRTATRRVTPAPRTVTSARPVTVQPRGEFITHYDPSRVIDLDRLKVVKDLRSGPEFAEGRGDTATGDNGVMSPSETPGGGRGMVTPTTAPGTGVKGGGGLILAALAAALLLGG